MRILPLDWEAVWSVLVSKSEPSNHLEKNIILQIDTDYIIDQKIEEHEGKN